MVPVPAVPGAGENRDRVVQRGRAHGAAHRAPHLHAHLLRPVHPGRCGHHQRRREDMDLVHQLTPRLKNRGSAASSKPWKSETAATSSRSSRMLSSSLSWSKTRSSDARSTSSRCASAAPPSTRRRRSRPSISWPAQALAEGDRHLATCRFIERHESVFFVGPAGVGKSHLAQTLGNEACRRGHDVLFAPAARPLAQLAAGAPTAPTSAVSPASPGLTSLLRGSPSGSPRIRASGPAPWGAA